MLKVLLFAWGSILFSSISFGQNWHPLGQPSYRYYTIEISDTIAPRNLSATYRNDSVKIDNDSFYYYLNANRPSPSGLHAWRYFGPGHSMFLDRLSLNKSNGDFRILQKDWFLFKNSAKVHEKWKANELGDSIELIEQRWDTILGKSDSIRVYEGPFGSLSLSKKYGIVSLTNDTIGFAYSLVGLQGVLGEQRSFRDYFPFQAGDSMDMHHIEGAFFDWTHSYYRRIIDKVIYTDTSVITMGRITKGIIQEINTSTPRVGYRLMDPEESTIVYDSAVWSNITFFYGSIGQTFNNGEIYLADTAQTRYGFGIKIEIDSDEDYDSYELVKGYGLIKYDGLQRLGQIYLEGISEEMVGGIIGGKPYGSFYHDSIFTVSIPEKAKKNVRYRFLVTNGVVIDWTSSPFALVESSFHLSIFDLNGREVMATSGIAFAGSSSNGEVLIRPKTDITLENLNPGVYIGKVSIDSKTATGRLLIAPKP